MYHIAIPICIMNTRIIFYTVLKCLVDVDLRRIYSCPTFGRFPSNFPRERGDPCTEVPQCTPIVAMSWTWDTCKLAPTLGRRRACPNANRGASCSARRSRWSTPVDPHLGCSELRSMFCAFSNTRRRRRRMRTNLYNIALGAAFVAAIPSGMGFVVPTPAGLVRGRVSSGTREGLGSGDLAARQRRLRTVEVHMVRVIADWHACIPYHPQPVGPSTTCT